MKLKKLVAGVLAAAALSATSLSASATTGPFYRCVKQSLTVFNGTITDAAVATPELSTLVSLVTSAGLADDLATAQNITVYAPTNAAFTKVDPDVTAALATNTTVLGAVLSYHVSPGIQDPRRWSLEPKARDTLIPGQQVFLFHDGANARVNNSKVNCKGVQASNGVVWLIDSVLLPQF